MPRFALPLICLAACPALAEETRQLDAHAHGTGALNVALDGAAVQMELRVPGADIVGFEYAPQSDADRAAVAAATEQLGAPAALFGLPEGAGCTVVEASAELEVEATDGHGDHDDDHGHDDHAHGDDHGDDDHAAEASHSEFHAEYTFTCADPGALDALMTQGYFDAFPNAEALEVQVVGRAGAQGFDASRDAPTLSIGGLL